MTKSILSVIQSGYRCLHEEQDDTVLWLSQSLRTQGGDLSILFRGESVNYLVRSQEAGALSFGSWKQSNPPRIQREVQKLLDSGCHVMYVEDDLQKLGLSRDQIFANTKSVSWNSLPSIFSRYEIIMHW